MQQSLKPEPRERIREIRHVTNHVTKSRQSPRPPSQEIPRLSQNSQRRNLRLRSSLHLSSPLPSSQPRSNLRQNRIHPRPRLLNQDRARIPIRRKRTSPKAKRKNQRLCEIVILKRRRRDREIAAPPFCIPTLMAMQPKLLLVLFLLLALCLGCLVFLQRRRNVRAIAKFHCLLLPFDRFVDLA
jgi:hypothetical protein